MSAPSVEERQRAGLRVLEVDAGAGLTVVVLHGYGMQPEDLAPFTRSIGVPARFYLPEGPVAANPVGRAWWPIDVAVRAAARAVGPRDLYRERPPGAARARQRLLELLADITADTSDPVVLVGFSQGGMLALDAVLRERPAIAALALLSSSRISADEWERCSAAVTGLPVLVSHGQHDDDLSFAAGEALRDFLTASGAKVTWVPHAQGHEIPLLVWRELRRLLQRVSVR